MPRKVLPISHEYPYHVVARSNNKENFYIPIGDCWKVFEKLLVAVQHRFSFKTHAFVLMSNHYHLIGTAEDIKHPLPRVMEWFQRSANRRINERAKRINHVFGGPYRACLISSETYYYNAVKYLYRNPVQAAMVGDVRQYKYSTLMKKGIAIRPKSEIDFLIPADRKEWIQGLNTPYTIEAESIIKNALLRRDFKFSSRMTIKNKKELRLRERSQ